jgi:tetratricopeptide (TPR) repeat protein
MCHRGQNTLPKKQDKRNSQSAEAVTEAGLEFARKGQLEKALAAFSSAIELDRTLWETYRFRGIAYGKLGRHELALKDLDVDILHDPDCAECFYERGTIKMLSGQLEDAVEDFSKCLDLDPEYAPAYSSRAGIFIRIGFYREALEDIRFALLFKPQNPDYLHNRAVILTALERYEEAILDYKRVIELRPKSGGSYNNLAWLLTTAKDPAYRDCRKAISYAGKALEIGRNGAWMDTLAAAYAECGEFEKAVAIEKVAYKLSRPPNKNFLRRMEIYKNGKTYGDSLLQRQGRPGC